MNDQIINAHFYTNNAYSITIYALRKTLIMYFSYSTLIGFQQHDGTFIRHNQWTRTTAKHYTQMGIKHGDELPDDEFTRRLKMAFAEIGLEYTKQRLTGEL